MYRGHVVAQQWPPIGSVKPRHAIFLMFCLGGGMARIGNYRPRGVQWVQDGNKEEPILPRWQTSAGSTSIGPKMHNWNLFRATHHLPHRPAVLPPAWILLGPPDSLIRAQHFQYACCWRAKHWCFCDAQWGEIMGPLSVNSTLTKHGNNAG